MKLKLIIIEKLFGTYNYTINLQKKQNVTILHAPNGMGKTTILKLVKAIIECDILFLSDTPFKKIQLFFDNKEYIRVEKTNIFETILDCDIRTLRNRTVHSSEANIELPILFSLKFKDEKLFKNKIMINAETILMLYRRVPPRYRVTYSESEEGTVPTVMELVNDMEIANNELFCNDELFGKIKKLQEKLQIHFIEANRIFTSKATDILRGREREKQIESIRVYSKELKDIINAQKKEKERVSEVLDRSFPKRILDIFLHNNNKSDYNEEQIRKSLKDLEEKRIELQKIGLVNENESADLSNELSFPEETLPVLNLYVSDNKKKLEVYDKLKEKLQTLQDIINNKHGFSNKEMIVDAEDGVRFILDNGNKVPLEKLSSGEKNDFILFYELIFKCNNNSLILIDEPEISLHITWQQDFINELLEICNMNNMQAIVATHSPNIVDEHWDLLEDIVK